MLLLTSFAHKLDIYTLYIDMYINRYTMNLNCDIYQQIQNLFTAILIFFLNKSLLWIKVPEMTHNCWNANTIILLFSVFT